MIVMIYLCATALLLAFTWSISLQYSRHGRLMNKIPGLPTIPIVGNLLSFAIPTDEIWPKIRYLYQKYYPMFRMWGFLYCAVFIFHPDDLKILLSCKKNINKPHVVYSALKSADADGIIISTGHRWQHHRKILNHAFSSTTVEMYAHKINKCMSRFIAELATRGDVFVENVVPMTMKLALGAVCDAAMDFDIDDMPPDEEQEFRCAVNELLEIGLYRAVRPYIRDFMLPFLPVGWRLARVRKVMDSFRCKIIDKRRKYHERNEHSILENCMDEAEDGIDNNELKGLNKNLILIDVLLLAEKKGLILNHAIAQEVITIVGAGYETTGMAMAFMLTLLAENQEQQNLARAEILEFLGDDDCITMSHVKKMAYLDRCVRETLRLFPTAPHIGRVITDDIRLSKHTLPSGALALMSLHDLHRDSHFWPEPDKFDPDRFLPENVQQRHPFAYLPFSAGPRNCIGQKLAIAEMKLMAAHVLYNFYLEPIDVIANLKLEMHITIKVEEIKLKFIRINRD